MTLKYIILFVFGLAIGSFLNVISFRYRPGQKLFDRKAVAGRSRCPECRKTLAWHELVPILSFFIQRGRCRNCKSKISVQYPVVEFLSGLIFLLVPMFNQRPLIVFVWLLIFIVFLLISIIDFRHYLIPNSLNLALGVLGLVLIFSNYQHGKFDSLNGSFLGHYAGLFGLRENIWFNHLFAAFLGMVIFGAIIFLSRGRAMGMGDFKLAGALGLIFGWPDILMIIILAFVIGALISGIFLIMKKKKIKDAVPFGPFLITAGVLTFFLGVQIIGGYFKLFGL